jgi:hypothetical protein
MTLLVEGGCAFGYLVWRKLPRKMLVAVVLGNSLSLPDVWFLLLPCSNNGWFFPR